MKKLFKGIMSLILILTSLAILALFILAWKSQKMEAPGMNNGQLQGCTNKSNCLCSETLQDFQSNTEAIRITSGKDKNPLATLENIIIDMGGQVTKRDELYLSAVFKSDFFGFVDDLELRWDASQNLVHLRAAARVGKNDLGTNAKRLRILQTKYFQQF